MKVTILSVASAELIESARFYAKKAGQTLGAAFIDEFEHALALITKNPELGAPWIGSARRFPLRRFPYNLVYQIKPDEIRVIALAHQRRKPGYWKARG